jgi:hypothetical protein
MKTKSDIKDRFVIIMAGGRGAANNLTFLGA